MTLPDLVADLQFPVFDWDAACSRAAAHHDERPTWAYSWPAGLRLLSELSELCDLRNKKVCDLGCGRGLLGFAALKLGAACVLFCDASAEVLEYVDSCIGCNGLAERASCAQHRWGEPIPGRPFDVILGGDILYRPECHADLISSIAGGLSPHGVALLSDPRQKLEPELSGLAMAHSLITTSQRRETYTLINFRYEYS